MQLIAVTKLSAPVTRRPKVSRIKVLDTLLRQVRRLTLITAPAGFGKTTAAAECYGELQKRDEACVWISVDAEDRDSVRFISLLVHATNRVLPKIGSHALRVLESTPGVPLPELLVSYINDICSVERPVNLFLDDYQLAETRQNNETIEYLARKGPHNFRLFVTSRLTPAIGIAALRVGELIAEVTQEELAFSVEETTEFANDLHGARLSREEIRALEDKTEGWVAGLQLALISLKRYRDPMPVIRKFGGSFREVADYLLSDVLCHLEEPIREFLFRTSILERMNAQLCNALTARTDGQEVLEWLEASNLFVVPLDDTRTWYRYHHVFRDFLRHRTMMSDSEFGAGLMLAASRACESIGLGEEAVSYALGAGAIERAAGLVVEYALSMIYRGHIPQLVMWLRSIPHSVATQHPRLLAIRGWTDFHLGRGSAGDEVLAAMEAAQVSTCGNGPEDSEVRSAEVAALRVGFMLASDDVEAVRKFGWDFVQRVGERQPFLSGSVANMVAIACLGSAQFEESARAAVGAQVSLERAGCPYGVCHAQVAQALSALAQGNVRQAGSLARKASLVAVEGCGESSYPAALTDCIRGLVAYEENRLEEAAVLLQENVPLIRDCGPIEIQRLVAGVLARLFARYGQVPEAHRALDALLTSQHEDVEGVTEAIVIQERVRLLEGTHGISEAIRLIAGADSVQQSAQNRWDRVADELRLAKGRVLIMEGKHGQAANLLRDVSASAKASQFRRKEEETTLLLARAYLALGEYRSVERELTSTWKSMEQLWESPRYLEEPETVRTELCECVRSGLGHAVPGRTDAAPEFESLSTREMEVLEHVAEGHGTRKIALDLGISENTVKWHVRNIMEKFSVTTRLAAVAHARSIGLLQ